MKYICSHYGGVKSAKLDLDGKQPHLIIGRNEAGKTSLVRGIKSLLTRDPNPLKLPLALRNKGYARDGDVSQTSLAMFGEDWRLSWKPGEEVQVEGDAPLVPQGALDAGLIDLSGRPGAAAWQAIIGARIKMPDLKDRLVKLLGVAVGKPEAVATELVERIKDDERGWGAAEAIAQQRAKDAKAAWESVAADAGERKTYGVRIAADWRPANYWSAECEGLNITEASEAALEWEKQIELARKVKYISQDQAARRKELTAKVVEFKERIKFLEGKSKELEQAAAQAEELSVKRRREWENQELAVEKRNQAPGIIFAIEKTMAETQTKLDALKTPKDALSCPHCAKLLKVKDGKAVAVKGDASARNRLTADLAKCKQRLADWQAVLDAPAAEGLNPQAVEHSAKDAKDKREASDRTQAELSELRGQLKSQFAALAEIPEGMVGENPQADDAVEERLANAKRIQRAIELRNAAQVQHQLVVVWTDIKRLLSESGLRAEASAAAARLFNEGVVAQICDDAGWSAIKLDVSEWRVEIGGRDARLCSGSERWRARAVISIASAMIHDSPIAIIDGADILRGVKDQDDTYSGLFKACSKDNLVGDLAVVITEAGEFPRQGAGGAKLMTIEDGVLQREAAA